MKLNAISLSLALAAVAAVPTAHAADWSYGGASTKDSYSRGGIAVPAPIPVPETFRWYLRADVGLGLPTGGGASATGNIFGQDIDPATGSPFGMSSSWFKRDNNPEVLGGFGAGLYLTPRLRADATVDFRTKNDVSAAGTYRYNADPTVYYGAGSTNVVQIDGRTNEHTTVRSTLLLANLYWDLAERGSRFVPYIGVGAGFAVHSVERDHLTGETGTDVTVPATPVSLGTRTFSSNQKSVSMSPAAAAMAGVGYTLDSGMVIDLSYRFAYMGSTSSTSNIGYSATVNGINSVNSTLKLSDSFEHALRAGVRWNIW